jgi:hypothetical protein
MLFGAVCGGLYVQNANSITRTAASANATAEDAYADLEPEARAAFTWFDSLGFPDVRGCQYARVATGRRDFWADTDRNTYADGFIIKEVGDSFTVLDLDLFIETFTKTPAGTPEPQRVGYEPLDLEQEMTTHLQDLERSRDEEEWLDDFRRNYFREGGTLPIRARPFVHAWACARNGLGELAKKLYDHAADLVTFYDDGDKTFQDIMAEQFAEAMMWRAVLAFSRFAPSPFGHPAITRPQLLQQFEFLIAGFPGSEHVERRTSSSSCAIKTALNGHSPVLATYSETLVKSRARHTNYSRSAMLQCRSSSRYWRTSASRARSASTGTFTSHIMSCGWGIVRWPS